MTFSASEITSLAARAARGAGVPPDQALSFGAAAAAHLAAGRAEKTLQIALAKGADGPICVIPWIILSAQVACGEAVSLPLDLPHDLVQSYVGALDHDMMLDWDAGTAIACTDRQETKLSVRVEMSRELESTLKSLAEKTFVPESFASRARGAGATERA